MPLSLAYIAVLHDLFMAAISFVLSLYLRLGEDVLRDPEMLFTGCAVFTVICLSVFVSMRLYRGVWRYASVDDLLALTRSVSLAILVFTAFLFLLTRLDGYPRSAVVINWMVLLVLLGAPRFFYRLLKDRVLRFSFLPSAHDPRIPVLLVGLTSNSELFLRETARHGNSSYRVVGIIDPENRQLAGHSVHSIPVFGGLDSLPHALEVLSLQKLAPRRLILGLDSANGKFVRELVALGESLGLSVAKLPKLSEFQAHSEQLEIRPIAIEDLLGRAPQRPNFGRRAELLRGKHILVTGAGGTIGSELCRQIASFSPASLTLIDHSEFNLYSIDQELSERFPDLSKRPILLDVRNLAALDAAWRRASPEIVFHAAALKHVPMVELNPLEAIYTNSVGTAAVADVCVRHGTERMVTISTDKAVHPSSIMGATKRAAEKYIQLAAHLEKGKTLFSTVRFGNVLGSSGSVIPLFQKQIARGGPVTVTHPEMTRYFMMVPEAVELVLQASTLAAPTELSSVYVLEMGEPVSILSLAQQMIRMSGFVPDHDIAITYTGLRPGEKLHEVLFYDAESPQKTLYDGILRARPEPLNTTALRLLFAQLESACAANDELLARRTLLEIVPEFCEVPVSA